MQRSQGFLDCLHFFFDCVVVSKIERHRHFQWHVSCSEDELRTNLTGSYGKCQSTFGIQRGHANVSPLVKSSDLHATLPVTQWQDLFILFIENALEGVCNDT